MSQQREATEDDDVPVPDVSGLITEDDTPVDNIFSEKQMRLLTEPLFASWKPPGGAPYMAAANVGVFPTPTNNPLVPDVFLSFDTAPKYPLREKRGRSYFIWDHGKPPDVVVEVVSNREGEELTRKVRAYERMRVAHYVVFDPWYLLSDRTLTRFRLQGDALIEAEGDLCLPEKNLGLVLWSGRYEDLEAEWLRWCQADGEVIATGAERAQAETQRADAETQRADAETQRAEKLAAKLRALGIDPEADA